MTTTSTDTMIFIASWLEPLPASLPTGAGEDDDSPMSRRDAGHGMFCAAPAEPEIKRLSCTDGMVLLPMIDCSNRDVEKGGRRRKT